MDLPVRARLPPAPYPSQIPKPPPRDEAAERMKKAKERRARRRKIIAVTSVIIVLIVVSAVYYYYEDSPYETAIVSKGTAQGTITAVSNASYALPSEGQNSKPTDEPSARIVISTPTGSFTTFLACWPVKYTAGQTTQVQVETQRNGNQQFSAPNLFCGGTGPGSSTGILNGVTTTSTTTHTTTTSTTTSSTTA